ncbi:MAG: helix-hairpin-helix domain-containing protein [Thermaurantimonas sp.]
MVRRLFVFCVIPVLFVLKVHSQVEINELELESEAIAENLGEDADLIQWAENLDFFRENKINLNTANKELLAQLGFLNAFQIYNLLEHRRKYGRIVSFYELEYLNGFDPAVLGKLEYFTYLGPSDVRRYNPKDVLTKGRHTTLVRFQRGLEERRGYELRRRVRSGDSTVGSYYLGDPNRVFVRHRYVFGNVFSIGFTGDKDAGEPFLWEQGQRGFDFYSGHIAITQNKKLKTLILGDYQVQLGQGLVLWSSLAFRKSPSVLNVQRFGRGFVPYNGLDENRFFRGAAVTYGFRNLDVSAFYSKKKMSSAVSAVDIEDGEGGVLEAGSIRLSGLHRTPSERAARNTLTLESLGVHVKGGWRFLRIGTTAVEHRFEPPLSTPDRLYQAYHLQGRNAWNASVDYLISLPLIQLFGEVATSKAGGRGMTHGAYLSAGSKLTYVLLFRKLEKEYTALFHAPFAESTGNDAETGFYTGFRWEAAPRLFINAYGDLYYFDWPRYNLNQPGKGRDVFVQADYMMRRHYNFYIRLREEVSMINGLDESVVRPAGHQRRLFVRLHQNLLPTSQLSLASRVEFSNSDSHKGNSLGWMVFQDVRYAFTTLPLKLSYRLAVFETDDFDSRIYAFEHDVLYSFSVPALYDRGTRSYLLAEYRIGSITFWMRYAFTRFSDRYRVSSGLQEIEGSQTSEIKLQFRIKL